MPDDKKPEPKGELSYSTGNIFEAVPTPYHLESMYICDMAGKYALQTISNNGSLSVSCVPVESDKSKGSE